MSLGSLSTGKSKFWVGFTVGTAQQGGLVVQFDNLRVTEP